MGKFIIGGFVLLAVLLLLAPIEVSLISVIIFIFVIKMTIDSWKR